MKTGALRADKTYRLGAERLLTIFIGEMSSLGFTNTEIIECVMERCDIDSMDAYKEVNQQFNHIKEITNA